MKVLMSVLLYLMCIVNVFAGFTDADKAQMTLENVFPNPGAEQGKVGWAIDTGGTLSVDTTTKLSGKGSIKFISAGATHKLVTTPYAIKHGPNCDINFWYKTISSTYTAYVMEGSNTVATLALPSNTAFQNADLTFVCADSSTTYHLHLVDSAGTGTIYVDDLYQGKNFNIGSVNLQDKQYNLTTACSGSSCLSGDNSWSTTKAVATVKKTREGSWRSEINISGTSASAANITLTFTGVSFDGTQACTAHMSHSGGAYTFTSGSTIVMFKDVGQASGTSWEVSCDVALTGKPSWATDYAAEQVVRAENANQFGALEWTGPTFTATTGNSLAYSGTRPAPNNIFGIATTDATNNLSLKVPSLNPGTYKITLYGTMAHVTANDYCYLKVTDGTTSKNMGSMYDSSGYSRSMTAIAYFNYTSMQSNLVFTIQSYLHSCTAGDDMIGISIEPVYPSSNLPQIINSVYSNFTGQTRVVYGDISSTGTVTKSGSGDWTPAKVNTGLYSITFSPAFSSTNYSCTYVLKGGGTIAIPLSEERATNTASVASYTTQATAGSYADMAVSFICVGNK